MLKFRTLVAVCGLVLSLSAAAISAQDAQTPTALCENATPTEPATREYTQAEQVLQTGVDYRAIFCTSAGAVYIDLFEDLTPVTVNNFVFLAQNGYYDNTTFHRVIQDFMAQGGDPTATGSGGPGYQFQDEFVGFLTFDQAGWLAMANAGPGTNGSQFFITTVATDYLNFRHTIFGQVLEGQENVEAIELRDPATASTPGTALQTVLIVTDPFTVQTTYQAPGAASMEQVEARISEIAGQLSGALAANSDVTGIRTLENVVASAPQTLQESYSALLTENGFDYRAAIQVENTACDLENSPFYAVSYTLDAFESREAASTVIATAADSDGLLNQIPQAEGFVPLAVETSLPYPIFIGTANYCETDMTVASTYWQRGNYVVTAQAIYPANSQATADVWLGELVGVRIYESLFADILRTTLN
jgi:cyclophilin family peptidyl-prolyl cis-trans isomerase